MDQNYLNPVCRQDSLLSRLDYQSRLELCLSGLYGLTDCFQRTHTY